MTVTWITLAVALVIGLTKLFSYLLSDKRKIAQLKARQDELETKLRKALAANDTVAISTISLELSKLRTYLAGYSDAK